MQQYPKNIKRLLREYMVEAYECELHRELAKLDLGFAEGENMGVKNMGVRSCINTSLSFYFLKIFHRSSH
jgi:hypothetical protein